MTGALYVFWDQNLLDWSHNKFEWTFGPTIVDEILNEIYFVECPHTILDLLSMFLNDRYCFRDLYFW